MIALEVLFWASASLLFAAVAGYPLLLLALPPRRPIRRDSKARSVLLVLPVHNGERDLEAKLHNCLALRYPPELRQIVVVSDGSSDRTVEIARSFRDRGVECLVLDERVGKVEAQNRVLRRFQAEIVVFTDVSGRLPLDALENAVSNFGDPAVGAVSCRDEIAPASGGGRGDMLYIAYDMWVRRLLNRSGRLFGATGLFYALRWELAGDWDPAYAPDFYVALRSMQAGAWLVEDERIPVHYLASRSEADEYRRKVRTITRGMWTLFGNAQLLNPLRHGPAALQLMFYKLARWLVPVLMLALLVSSAGLVVGGSSRFFPVLALQLLVYAAGSVLWLRGGDPLVKGARPLVLIPMYSVAVLASWRNLCLGRRIVSWSPTVRT